MVTSSSGTRRCGQRPACDWALRGLPVRTRRTLHANGLLLGGTVVRAKGKHPPRILSRSNDFFLRLPSRSSARARVQEARANRVRDMADPWVYGCECFSPWPLVDALTGGVDGERRTASHANAEPNARDGIASGYGDGQPRLFIFPLIDAASSDHGYRP